MVEMEKSFGALLEQLPQDTEVPGLLEDITNTGLGSGLAIDSIKLKSEISREFYVELPMDIKVSGTYHDIAAFVSGVAALPRIVTLGDFTSLRLKKERAGIFFRWTYLQRPIAIRAKRRRNGPSETRREGRSDERRNENISSRMHGLTTGSL